MSEKVTDLVCVCVCVCVCVFKTLEKMRYHSKGQNPGKNECIFTLIMESS